MKVLIVSSGNSGNLAPFVKEQIESLEKFDILFDYYFIIGKGISGYLSNINKLRKKIVNSNPDIIHAHYGLSGFLSVLVKQRFPVITTFHGNDIYRTDTSDTNKESLNRFISRFTDRLGDHSIFVNGDFAVKIASKPFKYSVIPCQVDLSIFYPMNKNEAQRILGQNPEKRYILFSSDFENGRKNYKLAKAASQEIENLELIELKGYSREEVNLLLNACDLALLTSLSEGSCQFIKEAMACNRPIVSTKAGDAEWVINETMGCYISTYDIDDVRNKILAALEFSKEKKRTNGRERIIELGLDSETIATRVFSLYKSISGILD